MGQVKQTVPLVWEASWKVGGTTMRQDGVSGSATTQK
jgi:hypothetical protein